MSLSTARTFRARPAGTAEVVLAAVLLIVVGGCGRTQSTTETRAPDTVRSIDSTSGEAAVEVVRDYYRAIDAREFGHAYSLWARDGTASGQTFEQFVDGFENTARVVVRVDTPGPPDAAAGSRYVTVPVLIRAVDRQDKETWYGGVYVLRRSVVDGATGAQRRWHIESARIEQDR